MQKLITIILSLAIFSACSSQKLATSTTTPATPFMNELSQKVGQLNIENCPSNVQAVRAFVRGTDLSKQKMTLELQNHLFQMRLNIKNIYAEGLQKNSECLLEAKRVLSDLRSLEEALGHNQQMSGGRHVASETQPSLFTDSHRQLVTNTRRDDRVTSLMDLRSGDVLLLHRVSQETSPMIEASRTPMDWTDVVVVYKDAEDNLYLMTAIDLKVKRRGWYQMSDWLKRSVDRVQVLRPVAGSRGVAEKLENRKLKTPYSFGDLIKKEFKLKTSSSLVQGAGEVVLGEDLEMSPDLVTLSEWKDYSFAYKSRVLTHFIQWIDEYLKSNLPQKEIKQSYYLDDVITRGVTSH